MLCVASYKQTLMIDNSDDQIVPYGAIPTYMLFKVVATMQYQQLKEHTPVLIKLLINEFFPHCFLKIIFKNLNQSVFVFLKKDLKKTCKENFSLKP